MPRRKTSHANPQLVPPFIQLSILPVKKNPQMSEDAQSVADVLRVLLERAEEGKISGLCFSVVNNDKTYETDCVGSYNRFPTDALGPIEVLKLKLARMALDEQWLNNNS